MNIYKPLLFTTCLLASEIALASAINNCDNLELTFPNDIKELSVLPGSNNIESITVEGNKKVSSVRIPPLLGGGMGAHVLNVKMLKENGSLLHATVSQEASILGFCRQLDVTINDDKSSDIHNLHALHDWEHQKQPSAHNREPGRVHFR